MVKSAIIPLSKEEVDSIIAATIDSDFYYMLFTVAKTTGRRLGEFYDVQVKDVDFENNIMMTKVLKRRRKVEKEALLREDVAHLIKRYVIQNHLKLEDYLFRKVSYRQIQNKIKSYAKKAGIEKNVSFHNFRHYFVTEMFKKGWTYDKIAKLTGHSSPGTLVHYDSSVASDIKEDAAKVLGEL